MLSDRDRACRVAAAALAAFIASGAGFALAEGDLKSELRRVVSIIKTNLDGVTEIRVEPLRDLTAGTPLSGAAASGLTESFIEECRRQGLAVVPGAAHIVEGRFTAPDRDQLVAGEPLVLEVQFGLLNRRGQRLVQILPIEVPAPGEPKPSNFAVVNDPLTIAKAAGLVGLVGAVGQPVGSLNADRLKELALNPTGAVSGVLSRSSPESPYAVEILARPEGRGRYVPLVPTELAGLPYVDIPKGYEYQIRVHNDSGDPIVVAPSIDGISTFHFCDSSNRDQRTGELLNRYHVVRPRSSTIVKGWFFNMEGQENVAAFLVTSYGDSAAGSLAISDPSAAGAIHLEIRHAKSAPKTRAVQGPKFKTRSLDRRGTGMGEKQDVAFRTVDLLIGETLEFLTVRYDR